MTETLNLDNALETAQEETTEKNDQENSKQESTETTENTQEKESGNETPENTDPFEGKEENIDFFVLNNGDKVLRQDMIDGFMRQDDYTKKTMELSEDRRQLTLAKDTQKVDTTDEKKSAIDLTEQNKLMDSALADMDETDPLAIVMKGIVGQNKQVIDFINNQTISNQEQILQASTEKNLQHAQQLIKDSLEKEAKNYNLPIIKGDDGDETNMRELWDELVLKDLQAVNEDLTLSQYNHRVNQIGKNAFKRLRTIISVASAKKVKESSGNDGNSSQNKEKKENNSSEETPNPEANKGLTLQERINNGFENLRKKRADQ